LWMIVQNPEVQLLMKWPSAAVNAMEIHDASSLGNLNQVKRLAS
jgi:hypothetical protein